ncbi:MAG: oligosaccharide flippase family protein [Evtepia sp.]
MQGVAFLTATGLVSQVIAFAYRILLSQMVGAEMMGLYQLILPVYSVLLSLTSVGLTTAVSNLSAQYDALGNTKAVAALRDRALRLFFLLAILPCTVLVLCSDGASVLLLGDARTRLGLILLVPCLLLTGIENLQKYYFYGIGRILPAALTELAEQVIRSVAVLGLLFVFLPQTAEKMVGLIVLGMIICEIFSATTQTILFHRSMRTRCGTAPANGVLSRRILKIAAPIGLTSLLGNIIGSANAVFIPRLLVWGGMDVSEATARFGVLFGMTLPMLFLPTAFLSALALVLTPKLSASLGEMTEIRRRIRKSVAAGNFILIPALFFLAVLGPQLGSALYRDPRVGDNMPLLALGVLFSCWQTLLSCSLNGLNFQASAAAIALISDALQLGITVATVGNPIFGLRGFVWGYVISSAVGAVLCWRKIAKETKLKLPFFEWFAAPLLAATLAAACVRLLYLVLLDVGLSVVGSGGVCVLFGSVLYIVTLQAQGIKYIEHV